MSMNTTLFWKNSKITYDGGKIPETMIETEMIWVSLHSHFVIEDFYFDSYRGYYSQKPGILLSAATRGCTSEKEFTLYANLTNVVLDQGYDRPVGTTSNANVFYLTMTKTIGIDVNLNIENITFIGDTVELYNSFRVTGFSSKNNKINNIKFVNATINFPMFYYSGSDDSTITNVMFKNCTVRDSQLMTLSSTQKLYVANVELINVLASSTISSNFMHFSSALGTTVENLSISSGVG
jgi:hypothetical protein